MVLSLPQQVEDANDRKEAWLQTNSQATCSLPILHLRVMDGFFHLPCVWTRLEEALDARLRDHVGGHDERTAKDVAGYLNDRDSCPLCEPREPGANPGGPLDEPGRGLCDSSLATCCGDTELHCLRGRRAGDVAVSGDVALILARAADALRRVEDVAAAAAPAGRGNAAAGEEVNSDPSDRVLRPDIPSGNDVDVQSPTQEVSGEQTEVTTSHFTCKECNYPDCSHYCGGMGCPGAGQVRPGAAACPSWRCGQSFLINGLLGTCEDTGGWQIEAGLVLDWWCYSFECQDEACTQPCPTFEAKEVVEWIDR